MHGSFDVILRALFAIIRQRALQLGDSYVNKAVLVRSPKPLLWSFKAPRRTQHIDFTHLPDRDRPPLDAGWREILEQRSEQFA